jgi:hypothetical protein
MSNDYKVVYSQMGEICSDSLCTLKDAIDDYKAKLEMDKQGLFDDRFVLHIEDADGEIVNVKV